MDGRDFDDLTRHLASAASRRRLLRGALAALGVGPLGGHAAPTSAQGDCPPDAVLGAGGRCLCRTTGRPPTRDGCPCPAGRTACGDACVDTSTDLAHCGGCDRPCQADASVAKLDCHRGACRLRACQPGLANCDGDLVCETALGTDTDCGGCGDACLGMGVTCGGGGTPGVCGCTDDGQACAGRECGLATTNCGVDVTCGLPGGACPAGQACDAAGQCVCTTSSCPTGCCDGEGRCRIDDNAACGTGGGACQVCTGTGVTCGGGGEPGVCGCTPVACTDVTCGGSIPDGCGGQKTCQPCKVTFFASGAPQTWTVPDGVKKATFDVRGAGGGVGVGAMSGRGGGGGRATAVLAVTPGQRYDITVGTEGEDGGVGGGGGFGGGGAGGAGSHGAAGGGGASAVHLNGDPLLIAGGGGGGGGGNTGAGAGGNGGGTSGQDGNPGTEDGSGGGGGTASAGGTAGTGGSGAAAGTLGQGGAGAAAGVAGGGGGGGVYGGGGAGGAGDSDHGGGGGGGGGGSFVTPNALDVLAFGPGGSFSDGSVTVTYSFG